MNLKILLCTACVLLCIPGAALTQSSTSWSTTGNSQLNSNCFIGTTDQSPLSVKTNGTNRIKIGADGAVSIADLTGSGPSVVGVSGTGTLLRMTDPGADSLFDCSVKLWDADGNFITPDCFIGSTNQQPFRMFTSNEERMRITSDGKVGIATKSPSGQLQIGDYRPVIIDQHTVSPIDYRRIIGFNTYLDGGIAKYYNAGPAAAIDFDITDTDLCFSVMPNGGANQQANIRPMLAIDQNGNVGIGTRNQNAELHVFKPNGVATMRLHSGDGLGNAAMEFWSGTPNVTATGRQAYLTAGFNQDGNSELRMVVNPGHAPTAGLEALKIDKDRTLIENRVGIGTAPGSAHLGVNGAVRITEHNGPNNQLLIGHDGTNAYLDYTTQIVNTNNPTKLVVNGSGERTEFGGDVILHGDVGIGTTSFDDSQNGKHYRLSVDGKVRCREVKVNSTWADHVFEESYTLLSLAEVEAYIAEYGHLPGMPTAAEVAENGVELGGMQVKLLEKIEELTLHLIRLEKENQALKSQIESLR